MQRYITLWVQASYTEAQQTVNMEPAFYVQQPVISASWDFESFVSPTCNRPKATIRIYRDNH